MMFSLRRWIWRLQNAKKLSLVLPSLQLSKVWKITLGNLARPWMMTTGSARMWVPRESILVGFTFNVFWLWSPLGVYHRSPWHVGFFRWLWCLTINASSPLMSSYYLWPLGKYSKLIAAETLSQYKKFCRLVAARRPLLNADVNLFEQDPPVDFSKTKSEAKITPIKNLWESYQKHRKAIDEVMLGK